MIHNTKTLIAIAAAAQGKKKARQQEKTADRQPARGGLCVQLVMYEQGTIAVVMRREVQTQ
jgi:hypothetical protein